MQSERRQEAWNPESTAAFWINRASRTLLRHFDARLRPLGFAMSHLPVLRALADGGSLSQTELAQAARVEQPTMAETLVRMVRDGVAQREPNPNDKRGTLISLTQAVARTLVESKGGPRTGRPRGDGGSDQCGEGAAPATAGAGGREP